MLALAACGETQDDEERRPSGGVVGARRGEADPDAEITEGLKTVSIPKQLGNPYEEFEHSGVDEALEELGGSNRITGPTDAGASSQISIINAAVQQKPDAIIIAGNDPERRRPGAQAGRAARRRRSSAMDSDVAPDARSVFINQVTTAARRQEPGRVDRQADRQQGRDRDPLGDRERDEPERLDRRDEGDAEEARVQGHQAREGRLRRRRRPEVLPGDAGPDPGLPEPQGHHLADHGRRRRRRALPVDLAAEGQGQADRPGLPEPDAQVRQGRHGRGVPAVGAQGRRLPRRPGRRGARRRAHHRRGGREVRGRPARRVHDRRRTARSCSAR